MPLYEIQRMDPEDYQALYAERHGWRGCVVLVKEDGKWRLATTDGHGAGESGAEAPDLALAQPQSYAFQDLPVTPDYSHETVYAQIAGSQTVYEHPWPGHYPFRLNPAFVKLTEPEREATRRILEASGLADNGLALRTKPLRDVFVDGHVALDYREAIPRIVKAVDLGGLVQDGRIAEEDMDTFVDLHDYAMRKRRESDYEQKARIRAELLKTPASRRKVSHASCPTCVERRRKAAEAEA